MQLFSKPLLANTSRNLQRFGLGVAVMASALASQSDAQTTFPRTNAVPTLAARAITASQTINRVHRYSLDESGNLNGQITVTGDKPNNIGIYAMQDNQVVYRSTTNASGEFTIAEITPGRYSIVVAGRNQLAVQGIMIDRVASENTNGIIQLSTIQTGYQGIRDLVSTALPKQIVDHLGTAEDTTQQVSATLSDAPIANQVRIINGSIRGQIVSLADASNAEGTTVHLLQNNKPVAQVEIDDQGIFTIPDVEAGAYDFIATADSGLAAMRIQAIARDKPMKMVSFTQQQALTDLNISLAEDCPCNPAPIANVPPQQVALEPSSLSSIEYASESIGFGGANGAVGGATGNFSNVSGNVLGNRGIIGVRGAATAGRSSAFGLSRLLTIASIAGTATALAVDDDDNDTVPASNANN